MSTTNRLFLADRELSCRLERAEARANADFVDAHARAFPESGAKWIEVAGALAMFDGVGSPCTQTFGLGMSGPVTDADMDRLEQFFEQHGAEVFHEVSPLADGSVLKLLVERGYHPIEFSSILFRPIQPGIQLDRKPNEKISVRRVKQGEYDHWAEVAALGWKDAAPDLDDYMRDLGQICAHRQTTHCFLAECDGQSIAAGALTLVDNVALLAGACTIPHWRNQGAQLALLEYRLRFGAERNCDIAMIGAAPGSASQRNAERQGFRIAYTRIKWHLGTGDT